MSDQVVTQSPVAQKAPPFTVSSFFAWVWRYLRPYSAQVLLITLLVIVEVAFNATLPMTMRHLIDVVLPAHDRDGLWTVVLILGGGLILAVSAAIMRDVLYARVGSGFLRDIRSAMFEHMQRLSLEYYHRTPIGDILTRFSTDMAALEQAVTSAIPWGVIPAIDVFLCSALLFFLDWRMALISLPVYPLCLAGPKLLARRANIASDFRKDEEGRLLGSVQENAGAQPVVKALGLERNVIEGFAVRNQELFGRSLRLRILTTGMERSSIIGMLLLQVVLIATGAYFVFENKLTIGTLASFQVLFVQLSVSLSYVSTYSAMSVQAAGGARHIESMLVEKPRVADSPNAQPMGRFSSKLEMKNVNFGYIGLQKNLDNVSLNFNAGQFVAFVGASGSGKSTVLNLLLRFYDPSSGTIVVDGRELNSITIESWRSQLGVVFQENLLFNTSIRENLRLGKLKATDAEIEAAARSAEIHEFIKSLPQGYDTPAGERGSRFSGGQRQRMALARALLRDPAILVLDEATSALDPVTEHAINQTLRNVAKNRTVISVTHRLTSVVDADSIFVMHHGRLAEFGPHRELLMRPGLHTTMWEKQTGFIIHGAAKRTTASIRKLKTVPVLAELDGELLENVMSLLVTENFPAGRTIVHQGDVGDKFYIIVRGTVEIFRGLADSQTRLAVLQDGDFFGEVALLRNAPRNASAKTLTDCTFLTLQAQQFKNLMLKSPALFDKLVNMADARKSDEPEPELNSIAFGMPSIKVMPYGAASNNRNDRSDPFLAGGL